MGLHISRSNAQYYNEFKKMLHPLRERDPLMRGNKFIEFINSYIDKNGLRILDSDDPDTEARKIVAANRVVMNFVLYSFESLLLEILYSSNTIDVTKFINKTFELIVEAELNDNLKQNGIVKQDDNRYLLCVELLEFLDGKYKDKAKVYIENFKPILFR